MNRSHPSVTKPRFQLFRGNGEAERLDRFLAAADPLAVTAPKPERRKVQRGKWLWSLALIAGISGLTTAALIPLLRQTGSLLAEEPAGKALPGRAKARLLVEEGKRLLTEDRNDEALADFTLATKIAPDYAESWSALANCRLRIYQGTQAKLYYQRALSLKPDDLEALSGLGNLYLRQGEMQKAEQVWLRGGLDRQLAKLYLLQGRYRLAEERLAKLLKAGADDDLVSRMSQAARARSLSPSLRSFLEPEPAGRSPWAESGWRLYHEKRYGDAADSFQKALKEVPDDVNALSGMGSTLLALDRPADSLGYFDQALSLRPDHMRSLTGRGYCLEREGQTDGAIAVWRRVADDLYPGVSDASQRLAWTFYNRQDYRQAALYLAPLARRHPNDSRVLEALSIAVRRVRPGW